MLQVPRMIASSAAATDPVESKSLVPIQYSRSAVNTVTASGNRCPTEHDQPEANNGYARAFAVLVEPNSLIDVGLSAAALLQSSWHLHNVAGDRGFNRSFINRSSDGLHDLGVSRQSLQVSATQAVIAALAGSRRSCVLRLSGRRSFGRFSCFFLRLRSVFNGVMRPSSRQKGGGGLPSVLPLMFVPLAVRHLRTRLSTSEHNHWVWSEEDSIAQKAGRPPEDSGHFGVDFLFMPEIRHRTFTTTRCGCSFGILWPG